MQQYRYAGMQWVHKHVYLTKKYRCIYLQNYLQSVQLPAQSIQLWVLLCEILTLLLNVDVWMDVPKSLETRKHLMQQGQRMMECKNNEMLCMLILLHPIIPCIVLPHFYTFWHFLMFQMKSFTFVFCIFIACANAFVDVQVPFLVGFVHMYVMHVNKENSF